MKIRCLTNNPTIIKKGLLVVEAIDGSPLDLFKLVRAELLKGYKLITHPLTGSIGPNINPYKSVILGLKQSTVDPDSLDIIDKAINYTQNLLNSHPKSSWDELSLQDFQLIDSDFVSSFIQKP